MMRGRPGTTLIELVVVLVLLAIIAAVAAQPVLSGRVRGDASLARLDEARRSAARSGRAVHLSRLDSARVGEATLLPTGEVVADSSLDLDPLTGEHAR